MGVALNFHYCFGQVTSVKIAHPARTCGSLKIKRVPACCKTKYISIKVKDSHQLAETRFNLSVFTSLLPVPAFGSISSSFPEAVLQQPVSRGPPECLPAKQPLFLLNRTFRI